MKTANHNNATLQSQQPWRRVLKFGVGVVLAAGFSLGALATQTINVNFGAVASDAMNGNSFIYTTGTNGPFQQAPAYYSGTTWNDFIQADNGMGGGSPPALGAANLLDSDGNPTTIGWTDQSTSTGTYLGGPATWNDHPDVKMLNGGLYRVYNSGSGNALHNRIVVSGLNPAHTYNLYIACSSSYSGPVRAKWQMGTSAAVTGSPLFITNTAPVKAAQTWVPGDNWVAFYNVAPDAGGNIYVWGQNLGTTAGYSGLTLNGFQLVDATGWQSSDKSIYNFGLNVPASSSVVSSNATGTNITWTVAYSQPVTSLAPTFTLADFATSSPLSGTAHDFSSPVDYTVTAQDGSTKVYHVTVVHAPASPNAALQGVTWGGYNGTIAGTNATLLVPGGTVVTALNPTLTISPFATVSPLSGSTHDFTTPVNYAVTAEDGIHTTNYSIAVLHSYVWASAAAGTWSTAGNWNPGTPISSSSTAVAFNTAGTYLSTQDLGDGFQLNQLAFGGATVTVDGSSLSLINNGGSLPQILQNGTTAIVISNAVSLDANATFGGSGSGTVTLRGPISGTGGLTKNGSGQLTFAGPPAYSGDTIINTGAICYQAANGFGTGPINLGNVTVNSGATLYSLQMHATGNLTLNGGTYRDGSGWDGSWAGSIYLGANSNFRQDGYGSLNVSATISGPGGVSTWENAGFGWITFTAANSYAGPTVITQGRLECDDANSLGSGGPLIIQTNCHVRLKYTGDHVVSGLTLNGVAMGPGSYGSSSSGAMFQTDLYFDKEGTGTVTIPGAPLPTITSFGLPGNPANIDQTASTITWCVREGTAVTNLAPTYTVSAGVGSPASGSAQDFSSPVTYRVVNGMATNTYVVTVNIVPALPVLDGLTLWLDAGNTNTMTIRADGFSVTEWRDQYGSDVKATTGNGAPAWMESGINGKPTVALSAANSSCMNDGTFHDAPVTVCYVAQMTGGQYGLVLGADNYWVFGYNGGNMDLANFENGWIGSGQPADTSPHLYVATIDSAANGSTAAVYRDGTLLGTGTGLGPRNLQLNGRGIHTDATFSDCNVSEVLVYNRVLSSDELTSVSGFLTQKYMPSTTIAVTTTVTPDGAGNYTIGATTSPATAGLILKLYKSNDLSLGMAGFTDTGAALMDDGGGNYHFFPPCSPAEDGTRSFYLVK